MTKVDILEQAMDFVHNYFIKEVYRGSFKIESDTITLDFMQNEQYFMVKGSVFNDGVFQYPAEHMTNEEFEGEIWALAIPKGFIQLTDEIYDWVESYGNTMNNPFNSESFGGYSYTKGSGTDSKGNNVGSWQNVFASRLNKWRKII